MTKQKFSHTAVLRISEYVETAEREMRYEKPLASFLETKGIGLVKGCNAQLNEKYRIVSVDIDLELADVSASLAAVQQELERLGVPSGSEIKFLRNGVMVNRRVGALELIELTLNLSGLSQEASESLDFHAFYDNLNRSLKADETGELRSVWSGPEETTIVICGKSADAIQKRLVQLQPSEALLKGARLQIRRKDPKAKIEEVRL